MIAVERTFDADVVREILLECWDEFAEDTADTCPEINVAGEYWLLVKEDGEAAGVYRVIQITSVLYDSHVCIRKKFRKHAVAYGRLFYCWLLENLYNLRKLVGSIPEFNRPAVSYAIAIGMTRQGYNSDAYVKRGELCGMVQFGITRQRMEVLACPR